MSRNYVTYPAAAICLPILVLGLVAQPADHGQKVESGTVERQTLFRAGEESYHCFRIPALVVSRKGIILAFAEARKNSCNDWADIDLVLKRSEDSGKTWSRLRVLLDEGTHSVNQPAPVLDRDTGTLWLVFCKDNQSVFVMSSQDDGLVWADPVEITAQVKDPTWKYVASGPGHGIQLRSSRLLIPAWGDTSPGEVTWPPTWGKIEFTFAMFSDDHGKTWNRGRPMYENLTEEAMAVETADGRVYLTLRSLHGKNRRGISWSEDGGYSWSRIQFEESLPDPPAHGSIIRLPDTLDPGGMKVLFANPASASDRTRLTIRLSMDGCKTWPVSRVLYEDSAAYSDMAVASDDRILCLFEADRYARLELARFDMEWLSAKRDPP